MAVSPASARFLLSGSLLEAIGHLAVPGESVSPVRNPTICRGFFAIGRRAEGYTQEDFFGVPNERVGVPLRPLSAVAVEIPRIGQ